MVSVISDIIHGDGAKLLSKTFNQREIVTKEAGRLPEKAEQVPAVPCKGELLSWAV